MATVARFRVTLAAGLKLVAPETIVVPRLKVLAVLEEDVTVRPAPVMFRLPMTIGPLGTSSVELEVTTTLLG